MSDFRTKSGCFRTDFYNYFMELAGTTKMEGSRINLVWQTIGSFVESGYRHIPLGAMQYFSGLKEIDIVCIMMHCNQKGYIEIWLKVVCENCWEDWGYVRCGHGDWAKGHVCAFCGANKLDHHSFEFTYLGEPFEWRILPGMDIDISRFF